MSSINLPIQSFEGPFPPITGAFSCTLGIRHILAGRYRPSCHYILNPQVPSPYVSGAA